MTQEVWGSPSAALFWTKGGASMQTAPVYSAPPTTYAAPGTTMYPTYMAGTMPGGPVPVYGAPGVTYGAPMPVQTVTGPVASATPAEPVQGGDAVLTTTTAVETAVSTQMFPPQPRASALPTIMGPVTQAWEKVKVDDSGGVDEVVDLGDGMQKTRRIPMNKDKTDVHRHCQAIVPGGVDKP